MPKGNIHNLIDNKNLTPEELRERAKKGGRASVIARREKKTMRETLELLLNLSLEDGKNAKIDKIKSLAETEGKNINVQEALLLAQIARGLNGDSKAFELIGKVVGVFDAEQPTQAKDTSVVEQTCQALNGRIVEGLSEEEGENDE